MALTVTTYETWQLPYSHNLWEGIADIAFDATYPTGGEAITADDLLTGAQDIIGIYVSGIPEYTSTTQFGGVVSFDRANKKLKLFVINANDQQGLDELTDVDLFDGSTVQVRFVVRK